MTKEISPKDIDNPQIEFFFPDVPESCRLLVGIGHDDFVASRIARAVEDADARLLNMNVTSAADADHSQVVALRIDHRNPERVARSLERYGYHIVGIDNDPLTADDTIRRRYDELMHYLDL